MIHILFSECCLHYNVDKCNVQCYSSQFSLTNMCTNLIELCLLSYLLA